jgi:hypothetical protein
MDAFPSFKKFLDSPAMMRLGLMSIKPDVGRTKSFPDCYFLALCHSDVLDCSCLVLWICLSNVLEFLVPLCNQAVLFFKNDNNTPTNQTRVGSNKIYLCSHICCSGSLGHNKLAE